MDKAIGLVLTIKLDFVAENSNDLLDVFGILNVSGVNVNSPVLFSSFSNMEPALTQ